MKRKIEKNDRLEIAEAEEKIDVESDNRRTLRIVVYLPRGDYIQPARSGGSDITTPWPTDEQRLVQLPYNVKCSA